MFSAHALKATIILLVLLAPTAALRAQPPVSLELVTDGPLLGAERDWLRMAETVPGTSVRIRGARASDAPDITNSGSPERPRYRVVGVLVSANKLILPGNVVVTLRDQEKLSQWIRRLQADGPQAFTEPTGPFGLTADQLSEGHQQLRQPVDFDTKGLPLGPVVQRVTDSLKIDIQWSPAAQTAVAGTRESMLDELRGVSTGVALAAALRPLGLAFALDRVPGKPPHIKIDRRAELQEVWPIGWPPQQPPLKTAPDLFKRITVEIKNTPLQQALDALQQRVHLPLLMDHNNLVLQQIDPATVNVSLPEDRHLYRRIFDQLLFQAGLKMELLVDEAEHPFLWVTTIKRK